MFETDLLRAFVAVVEAGGFTRAAERLHLTQSTVSAQLRRLEERAGCRLLTRSTRALALTAQGETLLAYARTILQLQEDARAHLQEPALAGRARIGASEDFAGGWLPGILRRFATRHPEAAIEVEIGVPALLLQALEEGRLDLVLGGRCPGESRGRPLWSEPLVWGFAGPPPTASAPLPLAVFPEPCPYREAALLALAGSGRPWRIAYVSPSLAGVRAAALAGLAVAPLPQSALGPELRALDGAEGVPPLPEIEFLLALRPEARENPLLRRLTTVLEAAALQRGRESPAA